MRRAGLLVIVLVVGACTGAKDTAPSSPPSEADTVPAPASTDSTPVAGDEVPVLDDLVAPEWQPETRSDELAIELGEQETLTPQQAVDVLGLALDDLLGATPSNLPPGDGLGDAHALRVARSVRDELSAAQRAVVDEYLAAGTVVGTVTVDGSIEPGTAGGSTPTTTTTTVATTATTTTTSAPAGLRRAAALPAAPIDLDYLDLLGQVEKEWDEHLPGHPKYDIELQIKPGKGGMDAGEDPDRPGVCVIRVFSEFYQASPSDDKIRFFFAHELFHCFQDGWTTTTFNTNPWVVEGSADWAAADLYRTRTLDYTELHVAWFTIPQAPLASRRYSAWPLFENARRSGLDVYPLIQSMFASPQVGVTASLAATNLSGVVFRKDWSSRTLRADDLDPPWQLPWPAPDASFGPHDNLFSLGARGLGLYNIIGAGGYTQLQLGVEMTPDVGLVTVTPNGGPLTTVTAVGTQTVGDGATRTFCFAEDQCECPGGTTSGAVAMLGPNMLFSFAASAKGTVAAVRAEEWKPDRCKDEPDSADGTSNGDPHLTSFDGLPFDVITLGEFVVARDPAGDFEVETRHEPFGFGAGTTAVAIGTGDHRITLTMPDFDAVGAPVVRVDGAEASGGQFDVDGVVVEADSIAPTVTWPDGATVEMRWFHGWFVAVSVPVERAARMEGLLGSANGDLADDLAMPDGTLVDTVDAEVDESPFALAWAVDEDTTLFDYAPGQSVATFRVPHPDPEPPAIDPDVIDECSATLGALAAAHEVSSCAYDVSATGEAGFVSVYVEVVDARVQAAPGIVTVPTLPPSPPPTVGGAPAPGQAGTPTLTLGGEILAGTLDATAGSVLLARTELCPDDNVDIAVHVVGEEDLLARAALCDPSGLGRIGADDDDEWIDGEAYIWLPGDGAYEVVVEPLRFSTEVGAVDIYTDPTPAIVRGPGAASGDERLLEGIADTVVYLTDPGATFAAVGFDAACAVEVYWSDEFPRPEPFDLGRCNHAAGIDFPPTDMVLPVVVFTRTPDPVTVRLTPD